MADVLIMKAVEYDKLSAKFRKRFPDLASMQSYGYWLQRKYDGCFGMAVVSEQGLSRMLSRTGEDYSTSCRHILAELAEALTEARGQGWDEAVVLGEVWHPELSFPTISGKFRKRAPAPELRFIANDILQPRLSTESAYAYRYDELLTILPVVSSWEEYSCHVAVTFLEHEWDDAYALALQWQGEGGYDGAILRDPAAGYTVGLARDGQITKVKPTLSLDLRVIDVLPGEGKHEGRAGALRCDLGSGKFVDVGTGLSDENRGMWWAAKLLDNGPGCLFNPHNIIGKIVEVEAMGWSTEGKLREPRLKGVRHDKETPDR